MDFIVMAHTDFIVMAYMDFLFVAHMNFLVVLVCSEQELIIKSWLVKRAVS